MWDLRFGKIISFGGGMVLKRVGLEVESLGKIRFSVLWCLDVVGGEIEVFGGRR